MKNAPNNNDSFKDEYLKFIFSYKVKHYRQRKNLSQSELSENTGLSASYLSEIEKGLKYPKPEKIALLSRALEVEFDDLVTMKLDEKMGSVSTILNSQLWQEFPFEQFGLSMHNLFRLLTDSPSKATALIKTIYEIGRNYDMQSEHFLLATLRSFQILNLNYFPEAEKAGEKFFNKYNITFEDCRDQNKIARLLSSHFDIKIDTETLKDYPELHTFRSIYIEKKGRKNLLVNPALNTGQLVFIFLKEIGYHMMDLTERATTFTLFKPHTFNEVFNNLLSSYFAGVVLMPADKLCRDLQELFGKPSWQPEVVAEMMQYYKVSPETLLHRVSQLLPTHFGFTNIHYMRFKQKKTEQPYLDKELNISDVFTARTAKEHHCAKWLAYKSLNFYQNSKDTDVPGIYAQRSNFIKTDKEFFNFTICRTLNIKKDTNTSMTLGILNDDHFKKNVRFWDDPKVPRDTVNETCERCFLTDAECSVRLAPATIYEKEKKQERIKHLLTNII